MNILVLLKDALAGERLTRYLRLRNHRAELAPNLLQAGALAANLRPHCIITEFSVLKELVQADSGVTGDSPLALPHASTVLVEPADSLLSIAEAAERAHTAAHATQDAEPGGSPSHSPGQHVILFDPYGFTSPTIEEEIRSRGWTVSRAYHHVPLAQRVLGEDVSCVLLGPEITGEAPHDILRSLASIRRTHPKPFVLVSLVDVDVRMVTGAALDAGADAVVVRRSGQHVVDRLQGELRRCIQPRPRGTEDAEASARDHGGPAWPGARPNDPREWKRRWHRDPKGVAFEAG